jgi:hypothetical protein
MKRHIAALLLAVTAPLTIVSTQMASAETREAGEVAISEEGGETFLECISRVNDKLTACIATADATWEAAEKGGADMWSLFVWYTAEVASCKVVARKGAIACFGGTPEEDEDLGSTDY